MKKEVVGLLAFAGIIVIVLGYMFWKQPVGQAEAVAIMEQQGCWWHMGEPGVAMRFEDPYYIMSIDRCGGTCRVHAQTREFKKDANQMCFGLEVRP